ncbi:ParB N-terminal domain-containing protein [Vibrio sp. Makdt]|uniref:ParB N-terminal domain-containing protein n=1 Tax=Vibrio sp. Makdt TaxID=2998828 RepID=UPI0022CDB982|nr:ParB N-terminal domain-containing protein [Vibrio sp. Makdt]MDA0152463.1 ParB N-terminal domain-containing protein [Vibrio sp. Makdt]
MNSQQRPSGTRGDNSHRGRSHNDMKRHLEGEVRSIAGKKNVRFKDITLEPDQVKVNVRISPFNPRLLASVSRIQISQLAKNIKENTQLMPVWAYKHEDKYLILDGSRRKSATEEIGAPLHMKVIEGNFNDADLRKIATALAMSEGMSFIEMGGIWFRQIEELKSSGNFETLRKFSRDNKLSQSLVSDAVRAHTLPDSLKNAFMRVTTLGRDSFKKLFAVADIMSSAVENGDIVKVREFEYLLLSEINVDMISHELEQEKKLKARMDYEKRCERAQAAELVRAEKENREPNVVDVQMKAVEITDNAINKEVFKLVQTQLIASGLVDVKSNENSAADQLVKTPMATNQKITNGISINLVNVGKKKEMFAVEVNNAIAATKPHGTVTDKRLSAMNDAMKSMDTTTAKLLLSMIEQMAEAGTDVDIPDNVAQIRKAG